MSETVVSVTSLNYLENAIRTVSQQVESVGKFVDSRMNDIDSQLQSLKTDFTRMIIEQRQSAAFQRAITEIIRVRQEVEQKFGNYKQVRDNMLGILQAADLSLIRESTISRCTEELMLNAPSYWLAPCLIALAAWISNNEGLAKRAINEAVRRDREKTCLLFALICRRNGRTETCFEWLSEYFKLQRADKMRHSIIAFIDAYANGVFGEDKDNVCDEHINHWMEELKTKNPTFVEEQKEYWKRFFEMCGRSLSNETGYQALKDLCPEFNRIDAFVSRIAATDGETGAKQKLRNILNAEIDVEKLINEIDEQLKKLVTGYEDSETELRDEETYLSFVKQFKGDEERAQKVMALIKYKRKDDPVDFASHLRAAVLNSDTSISAKKTAVKLLKDYIIDAYAEFITENKDGYPEEITLVINETTTEGSKVSWKGKTKNAENKEELKASLKKEYESVKTAELAKVKIPAAAWFPGILLLGIPPMVCASKNKKRRQQIENNFKGYENSKTKVLEEALGARVKTNNIVKEFCGQEDWDKFDLKENV